MADSFTPNYHLNQPQDGASNGTWGPKINQDLFTIDQVMFANQVPIGSITMYGGITQPSGWSWCQGQQISQTTYAALYAVIGNRFNVGTVTAGNFMLPNLIQRFPLGTASGGANVGVVGGAATVTLATANLPAHSHPIVQTAHTHGASQPAHVHPDPGHNHIASDSGHTHPYTAPTSGGAGLAFGTNESAGGANTGVGAANITVQTAGTGLQAAQPAITVTAATANITGNATSNTGSGTAVSIMPPSLTINFIIKVQ